MIFDFDDYHENNHRLDLLSQLKEINPEFRCTVFAIPALGSDAFWASTPGWIELAVHGWEHPVSLAPNEAVDWSYERTIEVLDHPTVVKYFVNGFKAPGWQISDATYQALADRGWWVADMAYNDDRRPKGLRVYKLRPGSWHGHIQNIIKYENGLEETFDTVAALVESTSKFQFVSEVV